MNPIIIPSSYNYIAVFLTFKCSLRCSYCINAYTPINRIRKQLTGQEWVRSLDRIVSRPDLPITLGGGEPTFHPDFFYIVNELHDKGHKLDLLTNSIFHVDTFMRQISPAVFKRPAPYASIRVSYHPETMVAENVLRRVKKLLDAGYHIGIWSVNHPQYKDDLMEFADACDRHGIDFRLKEFLGTFDGKMCWTSKYLGACDGKATQLVDCKTTELIVGTDGAVYRCHSDLYDDRAPIGSLLDESFDIQDIYRSCTMFGTCNPCDVKVKFDRFQQIGHCAVDIKFLGVTK